MLVYGRLAQRAAFALGGGVISLTPQGAVLVSEVGVDSRAPSGQPPSLLP